jgi:tetratricopeptide (TPR) repeat protein
MYAKQPQQALALLRDCHQSLMADASLADQFFPALRLIGAKEQHDAWFEESWQALMKNRDRFPQDDNVRNSAAWLAARAMKRLDDAQKESTEALRLRPNQAAYLDTMAEIHFARGNREKAVEWSKKAITSEPGATPLREQYYRFLKEPFPK